LNVFPLSDILKIRILVGYLGESAQFAWWPTSFYDASSWQFLAPVFSRTTRLSQYHGVLEAARRVHDEHLSFGTYHLFRVPEEIEQDLHNLVQRPEAEDLANPVMLGRDAALSALIDLAGTFSVNTIGPHAIGSIGELDSPTTLKTLAAAYFSAFSVGARTYPYLVVG
jgi:hypothetical protein